MGLLSGTRLGPYEVVSLIGAGGMGEVYRARDERLSRDVAIKVLTASFVHDPDRLRRFQQEARAAGGLNHPAILAIYDLGEQDGAPYIVSELLEGHALRERLSEGPLPPRRVIELGLQIAQGLAAAHAKGIVHRDLKPENLFLTADGRVKILDFGLAKLSPALAEGSDISSLPTIAPDATTPGLVLGSAGYMAPEQVRGHAADARSDIFALGAILYEMAAGRRAFQGESAVETLSAILREDPPEMVATGRHVPPVLDRIIRRCLEKAPADRFQSARDLSFALEALSGMSNLAAPLDEVASAVGRGAPGAATSPPRKRKRRWLRTAAIALGGLVVGLIAGSEGEPDTAVPRFRQVTFREGLADAARFAPDGQTIVYSASWGNAPPELFTAAAGSPESRALGIRPARLLDLSPSGELAISLRPGTREQVLARLPLAGGAPRAVLPLVGNADFDAEGRLVIVRNDGERMTLEYPPGKVRYAAGGGMSDPRLSPDGDAIAFFEHPIQGDNRGSVVVLDLESGRREVVSEGWAALDGLAWDPEDREVWFSGAREGGNTGLYRLRGDDARLVYQAPSPILLHDVAAGGRALVSAQSDRFTVQCMAPGHEADEVPPFEASVLDRSLVVDVAPDGKHALVAETGEGGGPDYAVYYLPLDGSPAVKLGEGLAMTISPDGQWALSIDVHQPGRLLILPTGPGEPRELWNKGITYQAALWLPDGKGIVFAGQERKQGVRLYVQALDGGKPRPFSVEGIRTQLGMFAISPDGRQVAAVGAERVPMLYPVEGGEATRLPNLERGDAPLRFAPDGRTLFVSRIVPGERMQVLRYDVATGAAEVIHDRGDMRLRAGVTSVRIAPDGSTLCLSLANQSATLYELSGLK